MTRFTWKRRWTMLSAVAVMLWAGRASAQVPAELPAPLTAESSRSAAMVYDETPPKADAGGCISGDGKTGCAGGAGCGCNPCQCGETRCGETFPPCTKHGDPWALSSILGENPPVTIGGWGQFGYHNNSDGVFNTHPHHLDLQQGYLYLERVADGSNGLDFGGRADILYGTDAQNTQAFGNHPGRWDYLNGWDNGVYGWAMPQLYGEVAWGKVSVKVGHFYTLLGYQVVPATGNFFYSIPFTFNFSEAFTHTGALATVQATDDVTLYAGWTLGWDTGFDQLNGGSSFLGGSSVKLAEGVTATYITTFGNLGWIGDGYTHSFVLDWIVNKKWEYVFQSDLLTTTGFGSGHYDAFSLNQYLYYTFNDCWKAGTRMEWWKADGVSYYEYTLGLNWMPIANLRVRPEWRYQWVPATGDANAFGIPSNQGIFAIDAIVTF